MARKLMHLCDTSTLTDLKLFQFGSDQYSTKLSDRPILSAHYTIHYVFSGSGHVRIGNTTYPVAPGSVFVVFPNQIRQIIPGESTPLGIHWLELDGEVLLPELLQLNLTPNTPILPLTVPAGTGKTAAYFSKLATSGEENKAHQLGICWLILGALAAETAQVKPQRIGNQRKYYVSQAIDLIQRCYMQDITVEDIAAYCRLNRSYLGKLFRDETGKSTQEYLIEYRMEVACRYLRETTAPIGTIALSVGYQNQLHFSRAFRKTYGMSPRDWQKEHRMQQAELSASQQEE
ncbi:MAG: AraC family transcriptional regulator [Eubacteriales bacterium]|nr:AraC family transcriptional regulator [Eubacteriales bacterium]